MSSREERMAVALALAIIPLLVVPLLVDLPSGAESTFFAIDWLIWIAFVLEYGIWPYRAERKALRLPQHHRPPVRPDPIPSAPPGPPFRARLRSAPGYSGDVVLLRAVPSKTF